MSNISDINDFSYTKEILLLEENGYIENTESFVKVQNLSGEDINYRFNSRTKDFLFNFNNKEIPVSVYINIQPSTYGYKNRISNLRDIQLFLDIYSGKNWIAGKEMTFGKDVFGKVIEKINSYSDFFGIIAILNEYKNSNSDFNDYIETYVEIGDPLLHNSNKIYMESEIQRLDYRRLKFKHDSSISFNKKVFFLIENIDECILIAKNRSYFEFQERAI